jgi:hypothetical protein
MHRGAAFLPPSAARFARREPGAGRGAPHRRRHRRRVDADPGSALIATLEEGVVLHATRNSDPARGYPRVNGAPAAAPGLTAGA